MRVGMFVFTEEFGVIFVDVRRVGLLGVVVVLYHAPVKVFGVGVDDTLVLICFALGESADARHECPVCRSFEGAPFGG